MGAGGEASGNLTQGGGPRTAGRDERSRRAARAWLRALARTAPIAQQPTRTLPVVIEEQAGLRATAPAIESPESALSYAGLAECARRHARWALARGIRPGDVVGLQLPNRADYIAHWLGLTRAGATVALIGPQLAGDLLVHAVNAVRPVHLIASPESAAAVAAVRDRFEGQPACWLSGPAEGAAALDPLMLDAAGEALGAEECPWPTLDQTALLIYTSGSTGLPKAARLSHRRLMEWSHWFAGMMDLTPQDRLYNCLPLHHSVGGVVAMGASLVGGGAVVLRPRFTVSGFWKDVADARCTVFQYIGELCRYLVNAPPAPVPTHALRLACGNGLRPEVWEAFRSRFGIPHVLEYYAATEANFALYNCEEEPGAIGRIPPFLRHRAGVALVRQDAESGLPLRDASGRCIPCEADEAGLAIGRLAGSGQGAGAFEGYVDAEATRARVLHDVFEPGDAWFQTGDLMRCDARGFYRFVDRVGATYRWKGENVSTAEVAAQLGACAAVREAAVYGVAVPGVDGRAGMAALVVDPAFDPALFHAEVSRRLPDAARPVFLRLVQALPTTDTHKVKPAALAAEGFDPRTTHDPLYVRDRSSGVYLALDVALWRAITEGRLRL